MQSDYRGADLPEADRAMLDYCAKLTRTPGKMSQGDVDRLGEVGFSEAAVHDICLVTSYFGLVNRLADGLGVELEGGWEGEPKVGQA